jgi:hypothetical protein
MRRFVMAVVAVGTLVAALAGVAAAQAENGTLTLSDGSVAAGIGFSWGKGTLAYAGKTYPVKVEGLSVGEVGVVRATAKGTVSNLAKLDDFSGNYVVVGAGATAAGEADVAVMKNQNGVVIELQSTTQGASLKLGAEGLTNRYRGGGDNYLQVITAQTITLTNQRAEIDILRRRMDASVLLVKTLGGGWYAAGLSKAAQ